MNKVLKEKIKSCDGEKLGLEILNQIESDDCDIADIGWAVLSAFENCKTEIQVEIANNILIAITGYSIESLIGFVNDEI